MMHFSLSTRRARVAAIIAGVAALGALLVAVPQAAVAGPSTVTQTFSYTGSSSTFTVPSDITSLTVTITGGAGGNGGWDCGGSCAPTAGGYRGVVSGTLTVTPGQTLTIGVGSGGANGANQVNSNTAAPAGGSNPLGGYGGGTGGKAGPSGTSGQGGAGGAASVLRVNGSDIVAGGGGGNGGSGNGTALIGRTATSTYAGRTDTTTTSGQAGLNVNDICIASGCGGANNDGGGGGAGGGGAQGGAQGNVEFGSGNSTEWFGYGGSVGQNSTASFTGLTASYQYYSTNAANGSVVISYVTGSPGAPTAVSGTAGNASVSLIWTAPANTGQTAITDYYVQYSSDNGSHWSSSVDMGSTATSGTVTSLTNGTSYTFQVAAVNSVGTGTWSTSSSSITPLGPPSAPTINSVVPQDGALRLSLTAPSSGATVTSYDYQLNGGTWVNVASTSTTITIPGLVNGTSYSVAVRAESAVGAGTASSPSSGTPQAVPGAPTITSLSAGYRSLSIAFTPGFNGGGTISSYQYTLDGTTWITASGTTSPITISGLSDGTTYNVQLRAVNGSGSGVASATASATTPAVPGAPTVSSVTVGDGTAAVSFTPGTTGGSPIDHYEYQVGSSGTWTTASSSSSPITITGLVNGTPVDIRIRAVNSVGAGTPSTSTTVTPATVPGAPSIVGNTAAGSDSTLSASFTAPSSDGGSAIVRYQYSTDSGATWRDRTDGGTTASPVLVTTLSSDGTTTLSNGSTYYVELRAVNGVGPGTASAIASGLVAASPSAPTISTVTAQPQALQVTFTAGSNGGSAITGYEYSLDGSNWTGTGTLGTTFTISGLTNGTSYPVQVHAINSIGTGAASTAVSGTPVDLPGRPTISSVVRSNQTLTATLSLANNGGSPLTAWQYSTDGGTTWVTGSGTSSTLVITTLSSDGTTRLSNGTGYALAVRAVTAIGTGPASATTTVAPAAAPAAPSIALTPGNGAISVAFSLGADGGSPVSLIEYSLDGGVTWTSSGTLSSPFTITGLTNGTPYGVQLRADNAIGNGTSSLTASTTPRTVPGAPTSVAAVSNTTSADVSWAAPASTGGATITSYTASAYAASSGGSAIASCTSSSLACSITGLTNGTAYYVAVTATNVAGTGAASSPRVVVTPLARPSAPTLTSLAAGDSSINVAFTTGAAGDAAISSYQYSLDGGTTWLAATGTTSPILITGLTNGTSYSIKLRAVSSAGVGSASNSLSATPYSYPSAPDPTTIIANGGNGQIIVSWAAPSMNGGTLLNYTASAFNSPTLGSANPPSCTTTTLSCTITGLTNGTTYYISLQTQNTANMFSPRSTPRVPATPSLTPGAPGTPTAVAGNAQATVTWAAPTSTGASAITGYIVKYSLNGGSYTQGATPGANATSATITGLSNGSPYTFVVYAVNSNGTGTVSAASNSVTPLAPGTAPTFGTVTSTATGFTSSIANYDAGASYSATATNGATVMLSGSTITVTGLSNGASSTVTVTAAKSGSSTVTATIAGSALLTGIAPTFSSATASSTGFSFVIANYDSTATYTFSATNGATVSRTADTVTVSGLTLGGSSAITVTVAKAGSTNATATTSGVALVAGTAPTFTNLVSTATGFTFTIANYDASLSYALSASGAATVSRVGANVTVGGLSNGASSNITVTVSNPGISIASAIESGAALVTGTAPTLSAAVSTGTGFTSSITNFDATAGYSATATNGATVTLSGSTVTVTGLSNGATSTVTVTASKSGQTAATGDVTGAALLTGTAPTFSSSVATSTGFTFTITNYDSSASYSVSATNGATVTRSGSAVTVSGLTWGDTSSVTVTASQSGYTDATSVKSGVALVAGTAPTFSNLVSTATGFTFTIANYDSALSYSLSATGSAVVSRSGADVTVTGLSDGAAADITVVSTDSAGVIDAASAVESGSALLTGIVPALSSTVSTATGFTGSITNYDPATSYSASASNGATVTLSGATITVTGLSDGAGSHVVVTATHSGQTPTTASVDGAALLTGTTPTFSSPLATTTGFTFTITNYDVTGSYTLSATNGATVSRSGSAVTVEGLTLGGSSAVTVTVAKAGSTDATAVRPGVALVAGIAPTFSNLVSTDSGFQFDIANFDASLSYEVSATGAAVVSRSGATVTVTGLSNGASADVTVEATDPGVSIAMSVETGAALLTGTAPTVSNVASTAEGYSFTITNPDADATYTVSSTNGTATLVGSVVTVTGLTPGQSAEVTIVDTKSGYVTTQTTVTAASLLAGITPLFGAPTATGDGFTFPISNVDSDGSYTVTTTAGSATVTAGVVTVTGLLPSASATVTVTVSHTGYTDASANQSSSALAAGTAPVLTSVVPTDDGFTFTITNYDSALSYTTSAAPSGVVVIHSDGTGTLSGAPSGTLVHLTVTATDPGVSTASASTSATTLLPTDAPLLSSGTPLAGGYRFTITNYDASLSYSFVESHGGTVVRTGDTVTVSGLPAGEFSETTVSVTSAGHSAATATTGGTSFPSGNAPVVSAITRTLDGFTFTLQLEPGTSYTVTSDAGTVTLVGSTVTVTGLAAGATTTVHVTASAPQTVDSTTDVAGTAIATGVAPTFTTPVSATGGFTVTISNYSTAASYRLATSAGNVTRNAAALTVSGLSSGASATVTVTVTRGGYTDASGSITGRALTASAPPAPPSIPVVTPPGPTVDSGPVPTRTPAHPSVSAPSGQASGASGSATGAATITSDGATVDTHVTTAGGSAVVSEGDHSRLTVNAQKNGKTMPLATDGVVVVDRGGNLWVTVSGLSPRSIITLWIMSRTTQLASGRTDVGGATGQLVPLPSDLKPGAHTLVVQGVDAAGKPVTMQLGFRVLDAPPASAVSNNGADWWWLVLVAILAIVAVVTGWFLVARRRRTDKESTGDEGDGALA